MDNLKYTLLNYVDMSEEEKNLFWIETLGKLHDEVSLNARTTLEHVSKCLQEYKNASSEQKDILWNLYDPLTKRLCDHDKWIRSETEN
jgi:hypothetical protein